MSQISKRSAKAAAPRRNRTGQTDSRAPGKIPGASLQIRSIPTRFNRVHEAFEVRLPDICGFEVCRRLKANGATSKIPIVAVSGSEQAGSTVSDALQVGASAFLFHPFSTEQLLAVVSGSVQKAQAIAAECNWRLANAG